MIHLEEIILSFRSAPDQAITTTQQTHGATITSLLRQNDVALA